MDRLKQRLEKYQPELRRRKRQPLQPIRSVRKLTATPTTTSERSTIPMVDCWNRDCNRGSRHHRRIVRGNKTKARQAESRTDSAIHPTPSPRNPANPPSLIFLLAETGHFTPLDLVQPSTFHRPRTPPAPSTNHTHCGRPCGADTYLRKRPVPCLDARNQPGRKRSIPGRADRCLEPRRILSTRK